MDTLITAGIDLAAMVLLIFPLYYRRHRRRDLVTSFMVLNVAVFAVAATLGSVDVGIGVGIGLFGALSIIRLRSTEVSQYEVAYYFASLSVGLIAGLGSVEPWRSAALIALILVVVAMIDARVILPASRHQEMRLDRAFTDEAALRRHLGELLHEKVTALRVIAVDLVNDTTTVDVKWQQKSVVNHPSTVGATR